MNELVFEVTQEADGGFCAECLSENIFTQGDTWEDLRRNAQEKEFFDQFLRPSSLTALLCNLLENLKSGLQDIESKELSVTIFTG